MEISCIFSLSSSFQTFATSPFKSSDFCGSNLVNISFIVFHPPVLFVLLDFCVLLLY